MEVYLVFNEFIYGEGKARIYFVLHNHQHVIPNDRI